MAPLTQDVSNLIGTVCWGVLIAFVPVLAVRGLRVVLRIFNGGSGWRIPE